jgi:hypothetical protein
MKQESCKDRIESHLQNRLDDIRQLWDAYLQGVEDLEDLGNIYEYGLAFDYVAPGTFNGQRRGYFRWQLSWGGPSDEFRFYCDESFGLDRVEYWFLDWFDGAHKVLAGKDEQLLNEIFEWMRECGTVEHVFKEATSE